MSEELVQEAVLEPIIEEAPAQTDAPAKKAKPTEKVAEATEDNKEEVTQKIISGPAKKKTPRSSNVHTKDNGAIGSHAADRALTKKVDNSPKEDEGKDSSKVAVWSDKNIRWSDVGSLIKGYNITNKEVADKWLTKKGVREATPEEVAAHYGK